MVPLTHGYYEYSYYNNDCTISFHDSVFNYFVKVLRSEIYGGKIILN